MDGSHRIGWGILLAPLRSGTCCHGVGAAREGPTDDSIRRVWPHHPAVSTTTWVFESTPLAASFIGIVFFCPHLSHVLFDSPFLFFFSSWMFLPAYTPLLLLLLLFIVLYQPQLRFGMYGGDDGTERWNRFNIIGSGQALMNGSLAGKAKGITGSFFWVASIDLR